MFNATVNMGGSRMESGTDYVATIMDIVPMKAVIQYPKELRWDAVAKKMRTVSDLSNDERAVFENTPIEPMMSQGKPVLNKDGSPVMKPKAVDQIRFVFQFDETGATTGQFDFVFQMYDGFRANNKFKTFVKNATGQDISDMTGMLKLGNLFPEGSKYVIRTKDELRDGKWVSYDPDSIRPYKDGMVLKTKDAGSTTTVTEEEVLEFLRGLVNESGGPINPLAALSRGTDKFGASYSDVYRALKDSGKIVIDGGKLTVG